MFPVKSIRNTVKVAITLTIKTTATPDKSFLSSVPDRSLSGLFVSFPDLTQIKL